MHLSARGPAAGAYFHPGRASVKGQQEDAFVSHVFVAEPPPFGVGSRRFSKHDTGLGQQGPTYHVAYNEISNPPRWGTKGWPGIDDAIKRGRGTSSGRVFSSMAAPSGPPPSGSSLQPMFATYPNETRLQELLDLQRRRTQGVPPPGTYNVPAWQGSRTFRRPTMQALDGPFPSDGPSTRVKEIAAVIMATCNTDVGPGEYEQGLSKEATSTLRAAPAITMGNGAREGRTRHTQTLSVSRSLQHGIDWHIPVIVQARPAQQKQAPLSAGQQDPALSQGAATSPAAQAHRPVQHTQDPPRYLDASPPRQAPYGLPPAPPSHVARSINKQLANQPGNWNWNSLDFNFRTSWTTLHGGAYCYGHRQPPQRVFAGGVSPAAVPDSNQLELVSEPNRALFGPETSSLDLTAMPISATAIFPIAEESSATFRDIRGSPSMSPTTCRLPPRISSDLTTSTACSPRQGPRSPAVQGTCLFKCDSWGASIGVQPTVGGADLGSPRRVLTSAQDLARRNQAMQAASAVQQAQERRSHWAARSGGEGSNSATPGSATSEM